MADAKEASFTESAYKTEAWHYRHAVVTGIIVFFSIFYLAWLGVFNACVGFISGVRDGWNLKVKPFIDVAGVRVPDGTSPGVQSEETTTTDDTSVSTGPARETGEEVKA